MREDDLWGDISLTDQNPIVELVEKQGTILAKKTKNLVRGKIRGGEGAVWHFDLESASFHIPILSVVGVDYPVELIEYARQQTDRLLSPIRCENEAAFRVELSKILQSERTRRALATILTVERLREFENRNKPTS